MQDWPNFRTTPSGRQSWRASSMSTRWSGTRGTPWTRRRTPSGRIRSRRCSTQRRRNLNFREQFAQHLLLSQYRQKFYIQLRKTCVIINKLVNFPKLNIHIYNIWTWQEVKIMHMSHVWSGVQGQESEIFLGRARGRRVGSIIFVGLDVRRI